MNSEEDVVLKALQNSLKWLETPNGVNAGSVTPIVRQLREGIHFRQAELKMKEEREEKIHLV